MGDTSDDERTHSELERLCDSGEQILRFFGFAHLPDHLRYVSRRFALLALDVMDLPRSAERTVALRKLLESKDAAVRAALTVPA